MKLEGKVAIVTGGGGGIGRVISLRYTREGASVVLAGPTEEKIKSVEKEITDIGGRAISVHADVAEEADVQRIVAATLSAFSKIDILVNNAGVAGPTALVHNITRGDWDRTFAINLTGAFLCAKHVLPQLIETAQRMHHKHNIDRRASGLCLSKSILCVEMGDDWINTDARAGGRALRNYSECHSPWSGEWASHRKGDTQSRRRNEPVL
jgi:NAD(P)-dependent dehydrogenase (short-subunit alcohol dehydrogenase family)